MRRANKNSQLLTRKFLFSFLQTTPNGYLYRLKRFAICISMHHSDRFSILRALKSPQKFRTPGSSSANFLGSWYISDLKSKSSYEILTFWCHLKNKPIRFFIRNIVFQFLKGYYFRWNGWNIFCFPISFLLMVFWFFILENCWCKRSRGF